MRDGVVLVEADVADGPALGQGRQDLLQHDLLALVGLLLRGGAVAAGLLELLEPLLDDAQVGQRELELQLLDVAGRIDAQQRVRHRVVLERADDVQQGVGIAQPGQLVGRDVGVRLALGAGGRGRQVDVGDVGGDLLLGLEELGQARRAARRGP